MNYGIILILFLLLWVTILINRINKIEDILDLIKKDIERMKEILNRMKL